MSILLTKGDHNTNVAHWQGFLNSQGFKDVTADSYFGGKTALATRGFQAAHGLRPDGIVGKNTISAAQGFGFAGFAEKKDDHVPDIGKLILVSAGHTNAVGQDRGVGANGWIEGVEAVRLRDAVAEILLDRGHSVIKDGADGVNEPLKKALLLAKSADVAVEIHFNSGPASATGVECLSKPNLKRLAQSLAGAVSFATDLRMRGEEGWKADNSGQHHRLAFCESGGVILEICFMTNTRDMQSYSERFDAIANNIAIVLGDFDKT